MAVARKVCLLSLGLLVVGFGCGYALGYTSLGYGLMHLGGLGSLSLLACGSGYIAEKKGFGFWSAFFITLSGSALIGTVGAYLVPPVGGEGRPAACGGSLSLVIALAYLIFWAVRKQRVEAVQ